MDTIDEKKVVIQSVPSFNDSNGITIDMLRLDALHPVISGNKWYKLKHNIDAAIENNSKLILTFGGPYSNHLVATAAACKLYNLKAIGIVRGNYLSHDSTKTLQECVKLGMRLKFVSKEDYNKKSNQDFLNQLNTEFNHPFIIPEGGANELGRKGAEDIARLIPDDYDFICVSTGTATTFIGLRNKLNNHQTILGFAPMKDGQYLNAEIEQYIKPEKNNRWKILDDWHFGGFGKWNEELIVFMNAFYQANYIPLDIVYTSKMMFGVKELIAQNYFPENAKILCIHSGGLQGNDSIKSKLAY